MNNFKIGIILKITLETNIMKIRVLISVYSENYFDFIKLL